MNIFAASASLLFRDPHIGLDGVYTPQGGVAKTVRVVREYLDETQAALTVGTRRGTVRYALLQSEVPTEPADGDTLRIGTDTYTIRSAEPDAAGVEWMLDVDSV